MGQDSVQFSYFSGGWGREGWLEKSDIKLISTQVLVDVEVELGNHILTRSHLKQ